MSQDGKKRTPTGDYAVGFCRPPLDTRFAKGKSGNKSGRPKGTRNLKIDLMDELAESITVREGDRQYKLSKQRALVKAVLAKAMKGDTRATGIVLGMIVRLLDPCATDGTAAPLAADDAALLQLLLDRHQSAARSLKADANPEPEET